MQTVTTCGAISGWWLAWSDLISQSRWHRFYVLAPLNELVLLSPMTDMLLKGKAVFGLSAMQTSRFISKCCPIFCVVAFAGQVCVHKHNHLSFDQGHLKGLMTRVQSAGHFTDYAANMASYEQLVDLLPRLLPVHLHKNIINLHSGLCVHGETAPICLESIIVTFIPFQICHGIGSAGRMSSPVGGFVLFISSIMHYLTALGERMAWGLITGLSTNWESSQKALKSWASAPLVSLFTRWVLINVLPSPQWMFGDKGCLASPLPALTPCSNEQLLAGQRLVPLS